MLAKLRHFVPRKTLLQISHLIFPYINYAVTVWGLASKRYLDKILRLQKRPFRFIYYSAERNDHAIPLFVDSDVLPVNFLYYESVCCLMYDVRNKTAPTNIFNLFTDTSKIHTYNTRSSTSNKFCIRKYKLEIQEKTFCRIEAKVWNELPASLRELTKTQFKKRLHAALTEITGKFFNLAMTTTILLK